MAAIYIKVNKKVADYLGVTEFRNQFKDGAYMLCRSDLTRFSSFGNEFQIAEQIGGVVLSMNEALEEQSGVRNRPLPEAIDERFKMPTSSANTKTTNTLDTTATGEQQPEETPMETTEKVIDEEVTISDAEVGDVSEILNE